MPMSFINCPTEIFKRAATLIMVDNLMSFTPFSILLQVAVDKPPLVMTKLFNDLQLLSLSSFTRFPNLIELS